LNARDNGVPFDELPLGPMLRAIYEEAGAFPDDTMSGGGDGLASQAPEKRILPGDRSEANLVEWRDTLGIETTQLEGLIIHGETLDGTSSIALWFNHVARSAEFFVDHETGITVIRSMAPVGIAFDVVTFTVDETEETVLPASPRTWERVVASAVGGVPASQSGTAYFVLRINQGEPDLVFLSEAEYTKEVMEIREVLSGRSQSGVGGELDS
jgi:hypothetical protein